MDSCKDCKFFRGTVVGSTGQCKRNPPVIIQEQRKDGYGNIYTEVSTQQPWIDKETDWCGEFKAE